MDHLVNLRLKILSGVLTQVRIALFHSLISLNITVDSGLRVGLESRIRMSPFLGYSGGSPWACDSTLKQ
jgi:hypothetical protein